MLILEVIPVTALSVCAEEAAELLAATGFTVVLQAPRTPPVCFSSGVADACAMPLSSAASDDIAALV